jgi:hypothetical protein
MKSSPLTADRYKQLLMLAGVDEDEAETARARMDAEQKIKKRR